jgi:hypothetical protein
MDGCMSPAARGRLAGAHGGGRSAARIDVSSASGEVTARRRCRPRGAHRVSRSPLRRRPHSEPDAWRRIWCPGRTAASPITNQHLQQAPSLSGWDCDIVQARSLPNT